MGFLQSLRLLKLLACGFSPSLITHHDVVRYYRHTCSMLPLAHDQLLLRYEFQKDNTVLGEDHFANDSDWVKSEIHHCLEFWVGEREGRCTPEHWKCWLSVIILYSFYRHEG